MPPRVSLASLKLSSKSLSQAREPLQQCRFLNSSVPANMSAHTSISPKDISETARAEGGTIKGSVSAQMQSQYTKERSAQASTPTNTSSQGSTISPQAISETARAEGGTTKGSVSAQMQSQHTKERNAQKNQGNTNTTTASTGTATNAASSINTTSDIAPAGQSRLDHERNLQEALDAVQPKIAHDPKSITQDDASLLESRERRAHGVIEKGSVTSVARSLADKNAAASRGGTAV